MDFIGGIGSDSLQGSESASTWTVTGAGEGSISGAEALVFSEMESFIGGTAADLFVFEDGASIAGDLTDLGDGTLDYSDFSSAVTVDLASETASAIGGTLSGVESFIGTAQTDTIVGPDQDVVWNVTAPDAASPQRPPDCGARSS